MTVFKEEIEHQILW